MDAAKPIGKDEVIAAVLQAAGELFAQKGPAATSIREVAARAGVNHGLLHRHFGSKRQLLAATLQNLADSAAELRESGAPREEFEGLLGPTLRVAFGLQDLDDAEIRSAVAEQIAKIVAAE